MQKKAKKSAIQAHTVGSETLLRGLSRWEAALGLLGLYCAGADDVALRVLEEVVVPDPPPAAPPTCVLCPGAPVAPAPAEPPAEPAPVELAPALSPTLPPDETAAVADA
jgi:hypothetical protein